MNYKFSNKRVLNSQMMATKQLLINTKIMEPLGQCFKDCSCNEDFKPSNYDYYTVERKNKKTTNHKTLEDANIRWDYVCSLVNAVKQM